ncbi:hypothetical protein [Muriicola sp. Z0-33]|uniref:hypothetical protein n=1 Tax=Muriicola sp. Z0-33 TaxID=2816957 RepID=UPI002237F6D1|nr:hypothetical protein [Muriicola sp. Z0-33]MCW5515167.1 hypothetical protein [Muriicola sp. Z0-33]
MSKRITIITLFIFFGQQAFSQTCCSGGVPLSNNLGLPNEGSGILSIGLNYDYNNLNTLNAGTDTLDDDSRERITNSILLGLGYAFTDRISFETLFSWVNQTRNITQFGNENFTETTGIGDAVLLVKYAIPDVLGSKTVLNIGVGAKAPLGQSDITTDQGILLTADLQPGSGAWDALSWVSISKGLGFRPSATISGSFTYKGTGKNKDYLNATSTYEFGDVVQANLGYTDQFLIFNTVVNPGLILKYRKSFTDRINQSDLPNTGGEWVFLRPELMTQITPDMGLAFRLEIPVYSYVEGTQLTPTLRFSGGLFFNFNIKKNNNINIPGQ